MTTSFLHGVQVVDVDDGTNSITTVASSVIGLVGTAPNADPSVFPLDKPVLIAGSPSLAASLTSVSNGTDYGTLPGAIQDIFNQMRAAVVVIRVAEGTTTDATMANIIGGVASDGSYTGAQALLHAESITGSRPRILIAPGFTHQRVTNGVLTLAVSAGGEGYTDGTYDLVLSGGGAGSGASATATIVGGIVTAATIVDHGGAYTAIPTFALPNTAGTGTGAAFTATTGTVSNAVATSLIPIATSLRAIIIQDGQNTTNNDAIATAGDNGSQRIYLVDPWITVLDSTTSVDVIRPSSAAVAGLIAASDNNNGFWWSPSNQTLSGVLGLGRPIDFAMGDATCSANLLNAAKVATIIRYSGFRLWGNRTLSTESKWQFLSVVRTADIINDSLQASMLWAVDRGITKGFVDAVIEEVSDYLRQLVKLGAILGGSCWIDKDLNPASSIANGEVYFDFDFTPPFPAEDITFRSHLTDNYVTSIF